MEGPGRTHWRTAAVIEQKPRLDSDSTDLLAMPASASVQQQKWR